MSSAHAVVFLYPLQGHIIPTYKLARSLAAQDLLVTVVCTHECHARIVKANNGRDPFAANACNIRSALVSDGLPQDLDRSLNHDDFMDALFCKMQPHVEELMEDLQRKGPPITCFIADTFFVWADRIAKKFGIPFVSFWTESLMVFSIYYHLDLLVKSGHYPCTRDERDVVHVKVKKERHVKVRKERHVTWADGWKKEENSPEDKTKDGIISFRNVDTEDKLIKCIPGDPELKATDLPSSPRERDCSTPEHRIIYHAFQSARGADWIISNTVEELERPTVEELRAQSGIPFYSVGPLFQHEDRHNLGITSLWAQSDCRGWLDSKPKQSVLYVSFGNYAHVSKEQVDEMAMGLLQSKQPFLWVLRPDIVSSEFQEILPEGFLEESKERGLIVEWVSQVDVLTHSSVGGFLTHCGWISVMESLWLGVPMLTFPLLTDQYTNRRLVVDEWGVAMNLGQVSRSCNNMRSNLVSRQEIAVTIAEFMEIDGQQGKKVRSNVGSIREIMKKAVMNGGSSQNNLDGFVEHLKGKTVQPLPSAA